MKIKRKTFLQSLLTAIASFGTGASRPRIICEHPLPAEKFPPPPIPAARDERLEAYYATRRDMTYREYREAVLLKCRTCIQYPLDPNLDPDTEAVIRVYYANNQSIERAANELRTFIYQ